MTTSITQSDALIHVSSEATNVIESWDQEGKPYLVARKVARITWTHVETEQPAGAILAGFDVVLFTGDDPDLNRIVPPVSVGRGIRATEIVFAPLDDIPTARAAVRARYSGSVASSWRILAGTVSIVSQVWPLGGGSRATSSKNLGTIASKESGTAEVQVPRTFSILRVASNYPARIRLYQTQADLVADASRTVDEDPEGDHGCLLEVVTAAGLLSLRLSPVATGTRRDDGTTAFLAVQNLDSEARILSATLEFLSLE